MLDPCDMKRQEAPECNYTSADSCAEKEIQNMNSPAIDDELLSSTLDDLSQQPSTQTKETGKNLEDLLDDLAESVYPSEIPDTTTKHKSNTTSRFESCLKELLKPISTSPLYLDTLLQSPPNHKVTKINNHMPTIESKPLDTTSLLFGTPDFDLLKKLEDLGPSSNVMESVVEAFLTKEVLGEPMQALLEAFKPWLEKYRQTTPPVEALRRYEEQYRVYMSILELCQYNKNEMSEIQRTAGVSSANSIGRLQEFQLLMEKLHTLGEPPQEVLDVLFAMTDLPNEDYSAASSLATPQAVSDREENEVGQKDAKLDNLLKNFESLIFGRDEEEHQLNKTQNRHDDAYQGIHNARGPQKSTHSLGLQPNNAVSEDEEDEQTIKEDIEGFVKFLRGLGLSGNEAEKFLNPEVLMKAAAGDISEDELVQLVFATTTDDTKAKEKSSTTNDSVKTLTSEHATSVGDLFASRRNFPCANTDQPNNNSQPIKSSSTNNNNHRSSGNDHQRLDPSKTCVQQ